jgi:Zn-dependent protease with chaperone function
MGFLDFVVTYFTSQPATATLVLLCSSLAVLSVLFRFEKSRPRLRLRVLSVSFAVEILTWSFLASSLLLCRAFEGLYQTEADLTAVTTVFSIAILVSMAVALPLSVFVTLKVPMAVARRLMKELPEAESGVFDLAKPTAKDFGIPALRILQSPVGVPFAYSVGGAESVMVVSKGLVTQLDKDEVETVLAHELAHVKNHDTALNTIVAVYRRVLFFDPFIRLMERAICSEKEFSADELSARETKKPLSLASALLKISSAQSGGRGSRVKVEGLSILGSSRFVRPPSVKQRIERLMKLATELEGEAVPHRGPLYAAG